MEKKFYQTHGNEYLKRICLYNLYAIDTNVYLLFKCKLNVRIQKTKDHIHEYGSFNFNFYICIKI